MEIVDRGRSEIELLVKRFRSFILGVCDNGTAADQLRRLKRAQYRVLEQTAAQALGCSTYPCTPRWRLLAGRSFRGRPTSANLRMNCDHARAKCGGRVCLVGTPRLVIVDYSATVRDLDTEAVDASAAVDFPVNGGKHKLVISRPI